jgi:tetratricopeptide (TPR) repeat protein
MATSLASKGIETAAVVAGKGVRSISVAIWRRLRDTISASQGYAEFEASWELAVTPAHREDAIRRLLSSEPQFAASLSMLLLRRDFVAATAVYSDRLPALDHSLRLSEVYIRVSLQSMSPISPVHTLDEAAMLASGNHIVEGDAGSGKSTFLRHLALTQARALLEDKEAIAFDELRLPVLVRANDLLNSSADIATTLHRAVSANLQGLLPQALPNDFFLPTAQNGHRYWLILVDAVDEIEGVQKRRELWDILRHHAERVSEYRFIVTTRPHASSPDVMVDAFSKWRLGPIAASDQSAFVRGYIAQPKLEGVLLHRLAGTEFRDITQSRLFLAMSARLFLTTGELYSRKMDLCEHYVAYIVSKAIGNNSERLEEFCMLLQLIAGGKETLKSIIRDHAKLVHRIAGGISTLDTEDSLRRLLVGTGIMIHVGAFIQFSHELFRSYFRALYLAERFNPSPEILKEIDPFKEGWIVMDHVLVRWGRSGKSIQSALRALLQYGEEGLRCAAAVIAGCEQGYEDLAVEIAQRLLREAAGEALFWHQHVLTLLAEISNEVRELLEEHLDSEDFFSGTFIAECLIDAGYHDEAVIHLDWLAEGGNGYPPDQVSAAELLLKLGRKDEALAALRDVAVDGDELYIKAEAASILFENDPSSENRDLLVSLCASDSNEIGDDISSRTLERLLRMGEADLALPHLMRAAELPKQCRRRLLSFYDAIQAARSITLHHDRDAGRKMLEDFLPLASKTSEKLDVVSALVDLGFEGDARRAVSTIIDNKTVEIDWRTIGCLIRLGMDAEVRSMVEEKVAYSLAHRCGIHHIHQLVVHALPVLDKPVIASFILNRIRLLKAPMLARTLALLGAVDDARLVLSEFLNDDDIAVSIRAAGGLCELGDSSVGMRRLRSIIGDRQTDVQLRMTAAERLKMVGLFRPAAIGFARIAGDHAVDVSYRVQAAIAFDRLEHGRNRIVWRSLGNIVDDSRRPVVDRVEAAEGLIEIDGDDGYSDIVYDSLFAMFSEKGLSDTDVLIVGKTLGELGWTLDVMPKVMIALSSSDVDVCRKIEVLRALSRSGENKEVIPLLVEIACQQRTCVDTALKAIEAIWTAEDCVEAQDFLRGIVYDPSVPPAWRLKAAMQRRIDLKIEDLIYLAKQDAVEIDTRVTALEALPEHMAQERFALLEGMTNKLDLTFWERKCLAESAHRLNLVGLRQTLVHQALTNGPLSVGELVAIAETAQDWNDDIVVDRVQRQLMALPFVILENSEDEYSVVDGLAMTAAVDPCNTAATLEKLLEAESTSFWVVPSILDVLAQVIDKPAVYLRALPIVGELVKLLNSESDDASDPIYPLREFARHGWLEDFSPINTFAEDERRPFVERVAACATVLRYVEKTHPDCTVAARILGRLCHSRLSPEEKLSAALELHRMRCSAEAKKLIRECLDNPPRAPKDRYRLGKLLHSVGLVSEAKRLVAGLDLLSLVERYVLDNEEEAFLRCVLGQEFTGKLTKQRLEDDDPFNQLWNAKENVADYGDQQSLNLILHAAHGTDGDAALQLEAIDCLNELGFRQLAREMFSAMRTTDIEPCWLAAQLVRFGNKAEAASLYVAAAQGDIDCNEHLIRGGLADLGLVMELMEFRSRYVSREEGAV